MATMEIWQPRSGDQGRSELLVPVEHGLWLSPDIPLSEDKDFILRSGKSKEVSIKLSAEMFAGLKLTSLESIRLLRKTMRTRYGQVFLEFQDEGADDLYQYCIENGLGSLDEIAPEHPPMRTSLENLALHANVVRRKAALFRWYYPGGQHLVGDAPIQESGVLVDGQIPSPEMLRRNASGEAVALRLTLDPSTRKYIPGNLIIAIDPNSREQRAQIEPVLRPVPETDAIIPYLVYSNETVTMPENMYGIVRNYAYSKINGAETHHTVSTHGISRLFDPGRNWKLIFEPRGRTSPDKVANYVDIDLFTIS